jgi:hypothetical protein
MPATVRAVTWLEQSREFFRSAGGRFDLWRVTDWDHGVSLRGSEESCRRWAALRATTCPASSVALAGMRRA